MIYVHLSLYLFISISHLVESKKFRASWRRVFGKEILRTTTLNDTVVHQISEMSSRVVVECTFSNFDKKKRKEKVKVDKKNSRNSLGNIEINKNIKETTEFMNEHNAHIINNECFNNDCNKSPKTFLNNNEAYDKESSQKCEYEMKTIFSVSKEKHCEHISETVEEILCE